MNNKFWFFGSKLNSVLLLILIILMIVALRWMYQDKEKYLPISNNSNQTQQVQQHVENNNVSVALPKYIGTMSNGAGWPPVIEVSSDKYICNPNTPKEGPTILERVINGNRYCVTSFEDAGAGQRYGEYTYTKAESNGTKSAKFSLHWSSCGGYGGPGESQYEECTASQKTFFDNLDSLIDKLMK